MAPECDMPIYAYRCASCGFEQEVLQKVSEPPLTVCPSCGQAEFTKQVTAAGFQLKGSGWYVTDFRDGGRKQGKDAGAGKSETASSGDSKAAAPAASSGAAESAPAAPAPSTKAGEA